MEQKIVSLVKNGKIESDAQRFIEAIEELSIQNNDPKKNNYSKKEFKLEDHLTYDVLLDEYDNIITSCGLFNGGRYPVGVFRCMNRTFVNPQFRVDHGSYPFWATRFLLPHQIESFRPKIKTLFVSREHPKSIGFLKKWCEVATIVGKWKALEDYMYQVVPQVEKTAVYQRVAILGDGWSDWTPNKLSDAEWYAMQAQESST